MHIERLGVATVMSEFRESEVGGQAECSTKANEGLSNRLQKGEKQQGDKTSKPSRVDQGLEMRLISHSSMLGMIINHVIYPRLDIMSSLLWVKRNTENVCVDIAQIH